jgi:SagB-type dehydrogenase family enzyme
LGYAQIRLHHEQAAVLLHSLAQPQTVGDLHQKVRDIPIEVVNLFLSLLLCAKTLVQEEAEAREQALAQWTFHDLLFHTRSRLGRHANPYGENRRFLGKIAPLPALKPPMSSEAIALYRPDIETLKATDPTLTTTLEERRSLRRHGQPAITLAQVGEFLYRLARVRNLNTADDIAYESSSRPYPNGGACYELELYLAANACQGLPFGLYHYDPLGHQLYRLASQKQHIEALLADAALSAGQPETPQLLIVLSARFQRVAWKYDSLAYALILKNVGALYQSMYLVATAMNLAPCALGGGNADLFALAAGLDYYSESSVGEFMLGCRAD